MEEKERVITDYLVSRSLDIESISKRQMSDLQQIYDTIVEMKSILEVNTISVKNVASRTHKKANAVRSISLATYYNNGHLLAGFVDYLKETPDIALEEELKRLQEEIAHLKEINLKLVKRDVKFESMQAEIDALRAELKLGEQYREAIANLESNESRKETVSRVVIKSTSKKPNDLS